ncbi:zinc finger protein 81-like isoform X1 [Notamacropus eugenii]|uniref:zinc finger protein 81-like isoform X1 n=1 Tax=Notamacropus eugenii TaxID=9315 RepID=UPI003B67EA8B
MAPGPEGSVTFQDVAVTFTAGELERLAAPQKELYREVMLENFGHLACLGLIISKTDVICQLERGQGPWKSEGDAPQNSCAGQRINFTSLLCGRCGQASVLEETRSERFNGLEAKYLSSGHCLFLSLFQSHPRFLTLFLWFSWQRYCIGLPFPSPAHFTDEETEANWVK